MADRGRTEGRHIATLLRSAVEDRTDPPFDTLAARDAGSTGTGLNRRKFDVVRESETVATVFAQDDRAYIEVGGDLATARDRAVEMGLRVRPKATTPPGLLVFVEDETSIDGALDVLMAAAGSGP